MKKVMKDQLQKISSRVGIIIFCVLIILIVQTSIKNIGIREIEYGPYTCDTNTLKIHIKEHKNRLEWAQWNDISLVWNNQTIPSTENYNFEGVRDFFELPWTTKCTPLIIEQPDLAQVIGSCLKEKIKDGTLEHDRLEKKWLPLALCGIGYADHTRKEE